MNKATISFGLLASLLIGCGGIEPDLEFPAGMAEISKVDQNRASFYYLKGWMVNDSGYPIPSVEYPLPPYALNRPSSISEKTELTFVFDLRDPYRKRKQTKVTLSVNPAKDIATSFGDGTIAQPLPDLNCAAEAFCASPDKGTAVKQYFGKNGHVDLTGQVATFDLSGDSERLRIVVKAKGVSNEAGLNPSSYLFLTFE